MADARILELRASPEGRTEIVREFDGLAVRLAHRFAGRGEPLDDLIQVARLGMVGALDRFETGHGASFATFATRTIMGELKRHLRDKAWSVRVPRGLQELSLEVGNAVQRLTQQLGRAPRLSEIAHEIGSDVESVIEALDAGRAFTSASLDAPIGHGNDSSTRRDSMGEVDADLTRTPERVTLARLIEDLDDREKTILHQRFFEGKSQSEIAADVGISQMHVSRLLRSTLQQLRAQAAAE